MRLIIKSNEIGKQAREKVPVLESKIAVLDSTISLQGEIIRSKDQLIHIGNEKEAAYVEMVQNYKHIVANKDTIINRYSLQLDTANKLYRKEKKKTIFAGIAAAAIVVLLAVIK